MTWRVSCNAVVLDVDVSLWERNLNAVAAQGVVDGFQNVADYVDTLHGIGPNVELEVDA